MMDYTRNLRFRVRTTNNSTFEAIVDTIRKSDDDDIGALYYVVAVVMIYGLSIVMMIASHIRKNKQDNQLRTYLKEMSILRKNDRREKIYNKISTIPQSTKNIILNLVQEDVTAGSSAKQCKTKNGDEATDSVFYGQNEEGSNTPKVSHTPRQDKKRNFQFEIIDEHVTL